MNRAITVGGGLILGFIVAFVVFPTRVESSIEIKGQPERVFDVVTTAKYWTQWHPATLGVSGA